MVLRAEHERELDARTSSAACFKGTELRRTLIIKACYCMQVICGTTLRACATCFFLQAGLREAVIQDVDRDIFSELYRYFGRSKAKIRQPDQAGVDTFWQWFLMPHSGRRIFFLLGLSTLMVTYFAIGGLGLPSQRRSLSWAIASLLVFTAFVAYVNIIPIIFAIVSELPSSLQGSKSVATA
jgi:MFS transporter, SP family, general alpha glucoside:H+ symporter